MLASVLETYESWDLKKVSIPSRSHLYQLEPVGIRTPMVESLTGYIRKISGGSLYTSRCINFTNNHTTTKTNIFEISN